MTLMGQVRGWYNILKQCKTQSSQPSGIREDLWCKCKCYDFILFYLILDFFFLFEEGRTS